MINNLKLGIRVVYVECIEIYDAKTFKLLDMVGFSRECDNANILFVIEVLPTVVQ